MGKVRLAQWLGRFAGSGFGRRNGGQGGIANQFGKAKRRIGDGGQHYRIGRDQRPSRRNTADADMLRLGGWFWLVFGLVWRVMMRRGLVMTILNWRRHILMAHRLGHRRKGEDQQEQPKDSVADHATCLNRSDVKAEQHDIAVFHDVFFAFLTHLAVFLGGLLTT